MTFKLRVKIFSLVSTFGLCFLLLGIGYFYEKNDITQKTIQTFQVETYHALREIDRIFSERIGDIEVSSKTVQLLIEKNQDSQIEELLFLIRDKYSTYLNIAYIDSQLIKRVDTSRVNLYQKVNWPIIEKLKLTNQVIFEHYNDPETKSQVISFGKTIHNAKGKLLGYLVHNVPQSSITKIAKQSHDSSVFKLSNKVELLKSNGEILYSNYRKANFDPDLAEKAKLALNQDGKFKFIVDKNQFWSFGRGETNSTINELGWLLVISSDKNEAYNALESTVTWLSFAVILVILLTFFAMSMTLHKMTKPLDEAVGRAKRFGEGDYNAFSDVQISNDEVGTLIHSLQAMAKKVQDALADQVRKARLTSLGELSTSIAHEINNPLLIISLNLEKLDKLLKSGNIDPEKMNNCIQVAHKTVYRIEKIVKGMKALAREGSADPFSQTSVNEIIEQAISVCQGTLRHENIILKIPSVDEKMTCECRGVQISQVLLNLINNASQANTRRS